MINITQEFYKEILKQILIRIGSGSYYSGTFEGTTDDIKYNFRVSLVIYRDDFRNVSDLVPIWYEIETFVNGVETQNDFLFSEMQKLI